MPIVDMSAVLLELGLGETVTDVERALAQACLKKAETAVKKHLRYDPAQATRTEFYPTLDYSREGRHGIWEVTDTVAYQRYLSEASSDELQVKHLPIRSVTDLRVDYDGRFGKQSGAFAAATAWTEGTDFWPNYESQDSDGNTVCTDGIIQSQGRWPIVPGSVKIVYVAGYTHAELHGDDTTIDASSIHEAIVDEATRRFLKIKQRSKKRLAGFAGPLASESLGDYSYSAHTGLLDSIIRGGDVSTETAWKLEEFVNWGHMLAG